MTTTKVRLGDVCEIQLGRFRAANADTDPSGVPVVRGSDLFLQALRRDELGHFKTNKVNPNAIQIRPGDILLPSITSRPCARIAGNELANCFAHHTITIVRPRIEGPSVQQLASYLSSAEFFSAARERAASLNGALRLSARDLIDIFFDIPLEEQLPSDSIATLMDRLVRDIIRTIARNPVEMLSVEWRILEHVLATALEGLGFTAELTPPSKDGGKDIILTCVENGIRRQYAVELKHWVSGKAVGHSHLRKFLDVVLHDRYDSGLFLSTSGFARSRDDELVHLEHRRIRLADSDKLVGLCKMYVLGESGVWVPVQSPTKALFTGTLVMGRPTMVRS